MMPLQSTAIEPTWAALTPALVLAVFALLLFVLDSIDPDESNSGLLAGTATVGTVTAMVVAGAFLLTGVGSGEGVSLYGGQLVVDSMALFFMFIATSVATLVCLASLDYLEGRQYQAEYYILVMLATTGMTLMAAANSLATIFVSLELLSLPSYALVAFLKNDKGSVEAGMKYFLVGALSSAVFAYGVSLVYGVTGSLLLEEIAAALQSAGALSGLGGVLGVGVLMVAGGFAFKTASVPFHFWAPEAYEGAPAPVSAFLSSASKAAGFVVAFRVFVVAFPIEAVAPVIDWVLLFQVLAVVTMTLGNFAAATQENVKRMLAYSSVGHAGYVLIGLAALTGAGNGEIVLGAGMIHLLVYGFMNTGAFLFVALVEYWGIGRTFEDYNGLATKAPVACVAMTVFMFSLAGLPIGGGFLSKYYLLAGAVGAGVWWLALVAAVNSALSLFYYSRVVKAMWIEEPDGNLEGIDARGYPTGLYAAVVIAAIVTVLLLPAIGVFSGVAFDAASAVLQLGP
ncbi:NADH-quinone oxidoreductase subunit N [Haloglomus halophilum]|uniref:NADH-quinone oxidoreductase subunit N n=1 Tax=Haloglomus halophilum TaxID=2962672 RepID=UPI0020C9BC34|nr:NADH-quinone oxidoreductase subunit N [Haloglomus halophilum]